MFLNYLIGYISLRKRGKGTLVYTGKYPAEEKNIHS